MQISCVRMYLFTRQILHPVQKRDYMQYSTSCTNAGLLQWNLLHINPAISLFTLAMFIHLNILKYANFQDSIYLANLQNSELTNNNDLAWTQFLGKMYDINNWNNSQIHAEWQQIWTESLRQWTARPEDVDTSSLPACFCLATSYTKNHLHNIVQ